MQRQFSVDDIVGELWKMGRTDSETAFQEWLKKVPSVGNLNNGPQGHGPSAEGMRADQSAMPPPPSMPVETSSLGLHKVTSIDTGSVGNLGFGLNGRSFSGALPQSASNASFGDGPMPNFSYQGMQGGMPPSGPGGMHANGSWGGAPQMPPMSLYGQMPHQPKPEPPALQHGSLPPPPPSGSNVSIPPHHVPHAAAAGNANGAAALVAAQQSPDEDGEDSGGDIGGKGEDGELDVRRQRRMLSNRESARRSRRRKQEHLGNLEAQIGQLSSEKATLEDRLAEMDRRLRGAMEENDRLRRDMAALGAEHAVGTAGPPLTLSSSRKMERSESMQRVASFERLHKRATAPGEMSATAEVA